MANKVKDDNSEAQFPFVNFLVDLLNTQINKNGTVSNGISSRNNGEDKNSKTSKKDTKGKKKEKRTIDSSKIDKLKTFCYQKRSLEQEISAVTGSGTGLVRLKEEIETAKDEKTIQYLTMIYNDKQRELEELLKKWDSISKDSASMHLLDDKGGELRQLAIREYYNRNLCNVLIDFGHDLERRAKSEPTTLDDRTNSTQKSD